MKLKKICGILFSSIMSVSVIGCSSQESSTEVNNWIEPPQEKAAKQQVFSQSIEVTPITGGVADAIRLRRPISNEQPMWIVHIDSWNYADPQKNY